MLQLECRHGLHTDPGKAPAWSTRSVRTRRHLLASQQFFGSGSTIHLARTTRWDADPGKFQSTSPMRSSTSAHSQPLAAPRNGMVSGDWPCAGLGSRHSRGAGPNLHHACPAHSVRTADTCSAPLRPLPSEHFQRLRRLAHWHLAPADETVAARCVGWLAPSERRSQACTVWQVKPPPGLDNCCDAHASRVRTFTGTAACAGCVLGEPGTIGHRCATGRKGHRIATDANTNLQQVSTSGLAG